MSPRAHEDERLPDREAATPVIEGEAACVACGRPLWWAGPPSEENGLPICAECDAARNFDVLDRC